jgi:glycosyltransferase involved in cell wall biosynthesis
MLTKNLQICRNPTLACRAYRQWHVRTTREVDLFCAPSQFLIDKHMAHGLKAGRTARIANGIPLPAMDTPKLPSDGTLRFVFAARLTPEKGCAMVLEAIRALPKHANYELTVAGRGPFADQFEEEAARNPRVKFLGYVEGPAKDTLFRASDCLLLPSLWYENAPLVILEAAAYHLAVIGSWIGAIPEFVQDKTTGLLFTPGDAIGLASSMMRLINEPGLARQLGDNAAGLAEASNVDRMVDAYEAEYERLMAEKAIGR